MKNFSKHPSEQRLSLFAGKDLGSLSYWLIKRHVARCNQCSQLASHFTSLSNDLSAMETVPAPDWESFSRQIRVAAAQIPPAQPISVGWRSRTVGGVVLAAAAVVLVLLFVPDNNSSLQPETAVIPQQYSNPAHSPASMWQDFESAVKVQITSEGQLRVRSYDAHSGLMMITDYYTP